MENEGKSNLRVGFLFPHPLLDSLGSTRRLLGLASNLKKLGVETLIMSPFEKDRTLNGVEIVNIPNIFSKVGLSNLFYSLTRNLFNNKLLCKVLLRNMNRTSIVNQGLLKVLQQFELDILQIEHEPTAASLLPILDKLSIPTVLDFHGIWSDELVESKVITKNGSEYLLLQSMIRKTLSNVSAIVVMSDAMKSYVMKNYRVPGFKIHVIELMTEPKLAKVPERGGPPKVIYAGILSREKHAQLFIESIPYISEKHPSTQFYITHKGDLIGEARKVSKTTGAHISFFWSLQQERLFKLMTNCHVGILTLPNNASYKLNPAAKFFDYLSVGLPVVSNDIGGWTSVIKEDGVGILTKDDPQAFSKGVLELIENPKLAQECGQRGLDLTKGKYNWNNITKKLLRLYTTLSR